MFNETEATMSFIMMLCCFLSLISQTLTTPANLINFGGSTEESKEAAYYLTADTGFPNTGPTDELKRTQRSFWKKLFKHGLFDDGDDKDCCNNCQYNIGDGNSDYNVGPGSPSNGGVLPNWQPFRPFQPWQPFPPLIFGGNFANRCGGIKTPSYGADNYNNNGANTNVPPAYDNNVNAIPDSYSKPEKPVYETPESPPPTETDNYADETPTTIPTTYDKPAEHDHTNNEPASYSNSDKGPYVNTKLPQILYQPIIYVSPQYVDQASNKLKQNMNDYITESKENVLAPASETNAYETPVQTEPAQYNSPASKSYNMPAAQTYSPCAQSSPSVSTVSTVYTIISPSLLNSPPTQSVQSAALAPQKSSSHSGPSKYSLYPSSGIPLQGYKENKMPSLPGPASANTLYSTPVLTVHDQPYRDCPELFSDYNRQHNNILPYSQVNSGNPDRQGYTFINAQVISH